jgi:very-short-patch-repair endonuclease
MTLRLLHGAGIAPMGIETRPHSELSYRLDILLAPGLALEVDGYSYHHSAQQMAEDARRRNRLQLAGTQTLVYTWRDIAHDGPRVVLEVRTALSQRVPA